jgi:hypothetical protein
MLHDTMLEKLLSDKTLKLIMSICKLQRKQSVVNMTPGVIFTALYFLKNLRIGPTS